ncbi:SPO22-domain-containing protein [Plenodomus tracheiphilus IPT5]|uniref:SPO22-domain-containing protein n=1 Tax=Plenodomus tracheiphilus IPT5 TaxID=1408161 RepID=A0A6A7B3B2_9PLEO|nr:SPO22-domain-containing protein [Plenodomus tracheiphilus IPT5]
MAPSQSAAKVEREKKLRSVLAFGSTLASRFEGNADVSVITELSAQLRGLPLPSSSAASAKQGELDSLGTELWNLSTRLRRDDVGSGGKPKDEVSRRNHALCLLRAFSFLLLDSAGGSGVKKRARKSSIRLLKIAMKAAKVCIEGNEFISATKILERAAEYQDALSQKVDAEETEEAALVNSLRVEYFALRMTLAWRQDRMDTAEHMFKKCIQLKATLACNIAETLADLMYEIGKDALAKRNYEVAVRWLGRTYDTIGDQDMERLSPEMGELRLSTMQSIIQAYMKITTSDALDKAWGMVKLMETDFGDKMVVLLLKIELLTVAETLDTTEFYNVLLRMIRTVVLNDTNFKTAVTACKVLDELMELRLLREENQTWIEKAVITRIWISTSKESIETSLEEVEGMLDSVTRNSKESLSPPATHAAQTLLWKRVEAAFGQEHYSTAEAWCRICRHTVFENAGVQNKTKVGRKLIQCASLRQDWVAARAAHSTIPETGKDEPVTRYLMYKVGVQSGDFDLAAQCLDHVCRSSVKDATLLYACVMEAQSAGNKRQAINALDRVLEKYDYSAPAGIHLPALLRCTARLLQSELLKDGKVDPGLMSQLCTVFDGACSQAKASRRRPSTPAQQLFTAQEFDWFSKNAYNLSLKYCAEIAPKDLVKLLSTCIEYQYYTEVRKHSQEFRRAAAEGIDTLGGSAQADIISKHFQVVKLELEAVLKLEKWDELDELFDQCWKYKSPDRYETLADLVLVIHSCMLKADLDPTYRNKTLSVLQKIINLTCRQRDSDMTKLSRWIRCLFSLSLDHDETISIRCIQQVTQMAATRQGILHRRTANPVLTTPPPSSSPVTVTDDLESADDDFKESDRYPKIELAWLATTTYNRAVDYYVQENDVKAKEWAEKSFMIAQWLEDDGALRDLLMGKFSMLKFDQT